MKRPAKFILCITFALVFMAGTTGCKKDPTLYSSTDIQIYFWDSGYGTEFISDVVNLFNSSQETYHATLQTTSAATTIISTLQARENNTYDLYFTMLNTNMYNNDFTKLDDVLNSPAYGENTNIREKYYPYLLDGVKNADGTTNFLTYGMGWVGLVYNNSIIDGEKYEVPRTTTELNFLVAELDGDPDLVSRGVEPWLFYRDSNNNGYWTYALTAWEAQYDGLDYYKNTMMQLRGEDGESPSKDVFLRKDGRYEALKVLEQIITPNTTHRECTNSDFTRVQTLYLDGEAVLTVNGSWLLNESTGDPENFEMMKMPVISSIVDHCLSIRGEAEHEGEFDPADAELSALIADIDLVTDGLKASPLTGDENATVTGDGFRVSKSDYKRVMDARNLMYNNSCEQYVFIPDYSPAKEGAKEFLRYFYSDNGTLAFMKYNKIPTSVRLSDDSKFDYNSLSAWEERQFDFADKLTAVTDLKDKASLFTNLSLNQFAGLSFAQEMIRTNAKKDADDIWANLEARVNENWEDWSIS